MVRGLYTAWTGMNNEQQRLDVIANNLANSATAGYKKEGVTSQSFDEHLTIKIRDESEGWKKKPIGNMSLGVKIGEIYTDYTQSSFRETGATYDLAIDGEGFFVVNIEDSNGKINTRYTRAGQFHITQDGYVVDINGNHVQSESGDLRIDTDTRQVAINELGVVYEDGVETDRVLIKDFENYDYLKKFAETYYEPVQGAKEKESTGLIRQGFIEQSNVNVVNEMVNMIAITRAYEAGQKVVKAMDDTLELAVTSLGRVQ